MTPTEPGLPARRVPVVRGWTDAALLFFGALLFAACAVMVHRHRVAGAEVAAFRAINDRTLVPFVMVWPIMQLGNLLVVPAAALAAAIARKWLLAVSLLVGGLTAYLLAAKVVRRIVVRGRPASLLPDVHIRGAPAGGLGFVSGHVAVSTALVVIAWPYLVRPARVIVVLAAALVALARLYVGAHLPLDVVGGAGLGLLVGGAVRLVVGRRAGRVPAQRDHIGGRSQSWSSG
jgi:membrane-associated phospholipid phosphatase